MQFEGVDCYLEHQMQFPSKSNYLLIIGYYLLTKEKDNSRIITFIQLTDEKKKLASAKM